MPVIALIRERVETMPIRTLHLSEDGVSRAEQNITLTRIAPGQITLNNQQVLAIRALDRCTLALEVLGETHYLPSADYWHPATAVSMPNGPAVCWDISTAWQSLPVKC